MFSLQNPGMIQQTQMVPQVVPQTIQQALPPQQILQANGKQSIDRLRMSPNSSVLIADQTAPIIWKCVSDSLGNVTAEPWDISPHKDEAEVAQALIMSTIDERLTKLEESYESLIKRTKESKHHETGTAVEHYQKRRESAGNGQPAALQQSAD